ncbi:anti-sigma factor [Kribbella sp. NBC_01505]|uniref:anti-sigma factor n=1 Tax=Kribbella sp. NBC_01505 TaxID=2903580 RepID=UPI00386D1BB8
MNEDIHSLAAPYVLDALPDDERILFERHLLECVVCADEVAGFSAAAVRLNAGNAVTPPPSLKESVMASIGRVEQLPPLPEPTVPIERATIQVSPAPVRRQSFGRRSLLALAAALVIVAGTGAVAVDQYRKNSATQRNTDQIAAVLAQPDARTVHGSLKGGGQATMVASDGRDAAVVVLSDLPVLPSDKTYQLWLIDSSKAAHSVGLAQAAFSDQTRVLTGGVAGKVAFGVTVEPRGGSQAPTMPAAVIIPMAA